MDEDKAQPAPVQEFGLTRERFNALEAEITTLQADWLFAVKEVVRLKAAQREQEPVSWAVVGDGKFGKYELGQVFVDYEATHTYWENRGYELVPVYTPPPQRPWVDLTEDEIENIEEKALTKQWAIRMALTAVKEKNA